jgi:hypothetical protein
MRYGTRIYSATVVVLLYAMIVGGTHAAETLKVNPECGTIGFVGSKDDGSHSR